MNTLGDQCFSTKSVVASLSMSLQGRSDENRSRASVDSLTSVIISPTHNELTLVQ